MKTFTAPAGVENLTRLGLRRKYVESSAIRPPNENVGQRSRKQPTLGVVVFTLCLLGDVRDSEQEKRGILETGREHLDHPWVNSRELGSFHPPIQPPSRGYKRSDRCVKPETTAEHGERFPEAGAWWVGCSR